MTQDEIEWTVEFTIADSKLEEFKKLVGELANTVQNSEPGALRYQWYLNEKDKTKCIVNELYNDSDAAVAHLNGKGVDSILVPKIFPIAKITRFEVFGTPSKELQEELAKLGANNFHYLTGFAR